MYSLNQVNKLVSCGRDPARSLPFWRGFLLIPLILVCFALSGQAAPRPETPDPGFVNDPFGTADGKNALQNLGGGLGNSGFGWFTLFGDVTASFNTACGAGAAALSNADSNTAVGAAALILNVNGTRNTAVGTAAMVNNAGDVAGNGSFNDAVGAFALNGNETGFSNNAMGDSALEKNITGAQNTAVGDVALANNDATGSGEANFNIAVGAGTLFNNVTGSSNTVVGTGAGPNIAAGFNNTYIGQFVGDNNGTPIADEDLTIRIADLSIDGFGSAACFIGGIFNNEQPVGGNVVAVTLNLDTDQLGFDPNVGRAGNPAAAPHRTAPTPRARPQAAHQAMLNNGVVKLQATVAQQQTTIEQQQKQIDALTAQLREQAAQIQKVSAQVEMMRPTPRVVNNK
jgi:uncharacterized coiled-coil protein SlyX